MPMLRSDRTLSENRPSPKSRTVLPVVLASMGLVLLAYISAVAVAHAVSSSAYPDFDTVATLTNP